MVFSSLAFLCAFLPVTFGLYCAMPGIRAKNALLLIASLAFYGYGEPVFVLLLVASALANWALGLCVLRADGSRRPSVLALAIALDLAVLVVFKYAGFFATTLNAITGWALPVPDIPLPVGVSFFTFQALSYVIDVYRGETPPEPNAARVMLYIALFPQLIAGPIVKWHDVADQMASRTITAQGAALGLRRFAVGLGKKVLLANRLAVVADALYAHDVIASGQLFAGSAWLAALAYALQIYFDFSAYSDMAIGLGRMFGFSFHENFNYPYASVSIKDFWRRWHISLSTWFKEYVYIPLGGNRKGRARAALNRLVVFFLCGLWHGASWTFVAWGLFHGIFLLLEDYVPVLRKLPRPLGHLYCLLVVLVGWVLFRAEDFGDAVAVLGQMVRPEAPDALQWQLFVRQLTPGFIAALAVGAVACLPVLPWIRARLGQSKDGLRTALGFGAAALLMGVCLLELSAGGYNPFIYFRF